MKIPTLPKMFTPSLRTRSLALGISLLALAGAAQAAMIVDAGTITAVGGAAQGVNNPGVLLQFTTTSATPVPLSFVLDLGSVEFIEKFTFENRTSGATNTAIRTLSIYVAPDETIGGFDPLNMSLYTNVVFSNGLTSTNSTSNAAGAMRDVNITDSTKRYFLVNLTGSFFATGGFSNANGNVNNVQFANIYAVPEPSTMLLGGAGLAGLFLSRRTRRASC